MRKPLFFRGAKRIFKKDFYPECVSNSQQSIARKQNKKCFNSVQRHFTEENRGRENKHMERGSTSLVTREMQIRTSKPLYACYNG